MRRFILSLTLIGCCLSLSGCWFFDAEHNRKQEDYIKADLRGIHQDFDFFMGLDHKPYLVDDYYR